VSVLGLSNIGHWTLPKIWVNFCTERTFQEDYFELILTVNMETRHPAEGLLGSKFLVICNSYGGLKSQDVEIL